MGGGRTSVGFGSVGGGIESIFTLMISGVGCGGTLLEPPLGVTTGVTLLDDDTGAACCLSGLFLFGEISSTRGAHLYTGVSGGLVSISGGVMGEAMLVNVFVAAGSGVSLRGVDVDG